MKWEVLKVRHLCYGALFIALSLDAAIGTFHDREVFRLDGPAASQAAHARALSALAAQLEADLGPTQIAEPLLVRSFDLYKELVQALESEQMNEGGSESRGFYSPKNGTAYAWLADGPDSARSLRILLHEAVHSYQAHCVKGGLPGKAPNYAEGLAEYYAQFERSDADDYNFGSVRSADPQLKVEAFQAICVRKVQLAAIATSSQADSQYGPPWAMTAFLKGTRSEEYRAWGESLEAGADPTSAWKDIFGSDRTIEEDFSKWVADNCSDVPFIDARGDWSVEKGGWSIDASASRALGLAAFRDKASGLILDSKVSDSGLVGIFLSYNSINENESLVFYPDSTYQMISISSGKRNVTKVGRLPFNPNGGSIDLRVRSNASIVASCGGHEIEFDLKPNDGLAGAFIKRGRLTVRKH